MGRVFLIGIAGDSGSGKTTFAEGIRRMFPGRVSALSMDDYHTLSRKERIERGITPLNPEMTDLGLFREHLLKLRSGKPIEKPVYDHSTGEIRCCERFEPSEIVIAEGLHTLYEGLNELYNYRIFVDPAREIKRRWKLKRDVEERGYRREDVIREIIQREPDYKRYVDFQKIYADTIVKIYPSMLRSSERIAYLSSQEEMYRVRLVFTNLSVSMKHVGLKLDLSRMIKAGERDFAISFFSDYYHGKRASFIDVDGFLSVEIFESLLDVLREETGEELRWDVGEYASSTEVAKLMICWNLVEVMKSRGNEG
ncbi:phosphoribulokinase [Geoglobus ahangari]